MIIGIGFVWILFGLYYGFTANGDQTQRIIGMLYIGFGVAFLEMWNIGRKVDKLLVLFKLKK